MRILFVTPQLPYPPHQGTALRNLGLMKGLAGRHRVSLLSFHSAGDEGRDPGAPTSIPIPLLELCDRIETVAPPAPRSLARRGWDTFANRLPDMALRLVSPAFGERLAGWLAEESFDVVHLEGIETSPYLDRLLTETAGPGSRWHPTARPNGDPGRGRGAPLIVFDDHNCEYLLQKSYAMIDARAPRRWPGALYSLIQWQKLRSYEAQVCRRADRVLVVSQTDAEALLRLVPGLDVTVIPNGIDTDEYRAGQEGGPPVPAAGAPTLVFTGKMDFRPNVDAVRWFADEVWPRVRRGAPEARFLAVGQQPHPQLAYLSGDPSITLTGWVADIRPYITNATVYVAPLRMGSGTRLKLLQAMAMGKAIVSTHLGAEGLAGRRHEDRSVDGFARASDGRELILTEDNDPDAFADGILSLLHDAARRASLGEAARAFVRAHYDWRVIIPRLEALYASA